MASSCLSSALRAQPAAPTQTTTSSPRDFIRRRHRLWPRQATGQFLRRFLLPPLARRPLALAFLRVALAPRRACAPLRTTLRADGAAAPPSGAPRLYPSPVLCARYAIDA